MLRHLLREQTIGTLRAMVWGLWVFNALAAGFLLLEIVTVDRDFLLPIGAVAYPRAEHDEAHAQRLIRQIGQLLLLLAILAALIVLVEVYEHMGGWRGVFAK